MSYGEKEYLHHKVIPGDFQQQHGLGIVLGVSLVLPQARAAANPPCTFLPCWQSRLPPLGVLGELIPSGE